jgi:hypothetical protein
MPNQVVLPIGPNLTSNTRIRTAQQKKIALNIKTELRGKNPVTQVTLTSKLIPKAELEKAAAEKPESF